MLFDKQAVCPSEQIFVWEIELQNFPKPRNEIILLVYSLIFLRNNFGMNSQLMLREIVSILGYNN